MYFDEWSRARCTKRQRRTTVGSTHDLSLTNRTLLDWHRPAIRTGLDMAEGWSRLGNRKVVHRPRRLVHSLARSPAQNVCSAWFERKLRSATGGERPPIGARGILQSRQDGHTGLQPSFAFSLCDRWNPNLSLGLVIREYQARFGRPSLMRRRRPGRVKFCVFHKPNFVLVSCVPASQARSHEDLSPDSAWTCSAAIDSFLLSIHTNTPVLS